MNHHPSLPIDFVELRLAKPRISIGEAEELMMQSKIGWWMIIFILCKRGWLPKPQSIEKNRGARVGRGHKMYGPRDPLRST